MSVLLSSLLFAILAVPQAVGAGPQMHSSQGNELRPSVGFNNVAHLPGLTLGWAR